MSNEPTPRDPVRTDPGRGIGVTYVAAAVVLLAALALVVLWTPAPQSTHTVSNTTPQTSTQQ